MTQELKAGEPCPCCGAIIPNLRDINLSPTEKQIYNFVAKRPGSTIQQIYDHLYYDREDGGPLYVNTVAVIICKMNRMKLKGQAVKAYRRGPGAGYRIIKIEEPII